jgi:hypothetical protein
VCTIHCIASNHYTYDESIHSFFQLTSETWHPATSSFTFVGYWSSLGILNHLSISRLRTDEVSKLQRRICLSFHSCMKKMPRTINSILRRWHEILSLPKQSPRTWYRDRVREELKELRMVKTPLQKLSETSDVFFSISRARYDGIPVQNLPPFVASRHSFVYLYMLTKYTLRWAFYRMAAFLCGVARPDSVREVVNPMKDHKLAEIASRHRIDPKKFHRVSSRLRRVWPLLP